MSAAFTGGEHTCHPDSQRTEAFETCPFHAPPHAAMSGNWTMSRKPSRVPSQQPEPFVGPLSHSAVTAPAPVSPPVASFENGRSVRAPQYVEPAAELARAIHQGRTT